VVAIVAFVADEDQVPVVVAFLATATDDMV
jgi:hypothetical protein